MQPLQAWARWVSENQKLKIFYLLQVAAYLAMGGTLDGDQLLSTSAWEVQLPTETHHLTLTAVQALHAGFNDSETMEPISASTSFSQGGVNQYRQLYQI